MQDMVAWGLQHNDLKLLKVPRCNNSSKNPYYGVQDKDLRLLKGPNKVFKA